MMLKNQRFAWISLFVRFLNGHFSTKIIIKAFVGAFLLSNFIFLAMAENQILNFISPFLTLAGIYVIINLSRAGFFSAGFFTGILWFYWIGFSFIYYELVWLIPFVILFIALVYGLLFWIASFPSFVALRAVLLFLVSYVHPFGFNWFNLEATLVLGAFEPNTRGLIFIFLAAISLSLKGKILKFILAFICLIAALQFKSSEAKTLPFDVELVNTNVAQRVRWDKSLRMKFTNENLDLISSAIAEQKRLIVLPESAFPLFMTNEPLLVDELKELSKKITIVAGALAYENKQIYNSAFLFQDSTLRRMDKKFLVPFGEEIPLPKFMQDAVNKLFFGGASDFKKAENFSNYEIDGVMIRNAICYEATREELYRGEFDVVVAITNNGWFVPSSEPVLQRVLIKHLATKYNKAVYHSVNGSKSEIIKPKKAFWDEF